MYNIDILNNITDFPLDLDSTFSDYYKKVADVIKKVPTNTSDQFSGDKYYVQKIQKICKILQKNTNYNVKIIKGFVKIFYSLKI